MNKLNYFLTIILLIGLTITANAQWQQIGDNILAEGNDNRTEAISFNKDGTIVAIGADHNDGPDGTHYQMGHVRVYENIAGVWTQKGTDIDGESDGDYSGESLSLNSDGNIVVIGARYNDGNGTSSGHARIFEFNGTDWVQKGTDIDGEHGGDKFGNAVSINADGNFVAISSEDNDDAGNNAGHVRVFNYKNSDWVQLGTDIDGNGDDDEFGKDVKISDDGLTIAVGAQDYTNPNGRRAGRIDVLTFNGADWVQVGQSINGTAFGEKFGRRLDLSADGTIVIGTSLQKSGLARVYKLNSGTWTQIGSDIIGDAVGDDFGYSVSISDDGSYFAIGAKESNSGAGKTVVYKNDNNSWVQVGDDILAQGANNEEGVGVSIALDCNGLYLASTAKRYAGSGVARVFEYPMSPEISLNPDDISVCVGENLQLSVEGNFICEYQWQLSMNGGSSFNNLTEAGLYSNVNTATLNITGAINPMDGWQYRCVVTNNNGSINSQAATTTIKDATEITTQPISQTDIDAGTNVTFSVTATASNIMYQWKKNGGNLTDGGNVSGATTNELTLSTVTESDAGTYTCIVTGDCGEETTTDAILSIAVGINDISNSKISVYPNPTNGQFTINLEASSRPSSVSKIEITDITGKTIKQLSIDNYQIDISNQPTGIYFIKIQTNKGLFIRKIIKK